MYYKFSSELKPILVKLSGFISNLHSLLLTCNNTFLFLSIVEKSKSLIKSKTIVGSELSCL